MTLKLADGRQLEPSVVTGGQVRVQGAVRDALTFVFPGTRDLSELDGAFTPEACETITIVETVDAQDAAPLAAEAAQPATEEHVYQGYTIRAELVKTVVETSKETPQSPAAYEDRVTVIMAQRTYAETQLARLQATVAALSKAQRSILAEAEEARRLDERAEIPAGDAQAADEADKTEGS